MAASLSDKAVAVFAFAAYHQMTSGENVKDVVLADGAGHHADPEAVAELEGAKLLTANGDRGEFTPDGLAKLAQVVEALRSAAA